MIYELRTYTLQPGTQGQYLKNSAEIVVAEECGASPAWKVAPRKSSCSEN